jgi:hypothetical protein
LASPWVARRQVALFASCDPVTALFLHRGETAHVEAGAKRAPLAGQYYRSQAFFAGEPVRSGDQRIEHRGIERVHLVRSHQADIGDALRDRDLDATIHQNSPLHFLIVAALQKGVVRI